MDFRPQFTIQDTPVERELQELQELQHLVWTCTRQRVTISQQMHYIGNLRGHIDAISAENAGLQQETNTIMGVNSELTRKLASSAMQIKALQRRVQTLQSMLQYYHDVRSHERSAEPSMSLQGSTALTNANIGGNTRDSVHASDGPTKEPVIDPPHNKVENSVLLNPHSPPFTPSHAKGTSESNLSPLSQPFHLLPRIVDSSQEVTNESPNLPISSSTTEARNLQASAIQVERLTSDNTQKEPVSAVAKKKIRAGFSSYIAPPLRGQSNQAAHQHLKESPLRRAAHFKTSAADAQAHNTNTPSAPSTTLPIVEAQNTAQNNDAINSCLDLWEETPHNSTIETTSDPPPSDPYKLIDFDSEPAVESQGGLPPQPIFTLRRVRRVSLSIEYLLDLLARLRAGEPIQNFTGEIIEFNALVERKMKTFGVMSNTPPTVNNQNQGAPASSGSRSSNKKEGTTQAAPGTMDGTDPPTLEVQPIISGSPSKEGTIEAASDNMEGTLPPKPQPQPILFDFPPNFGEPIITTTTPESMEKTKTGTPEPRSQARSWFGHEIKGDPPGSDEKPAIVGSHVLGGTLDLKTKFLIMNDTPYSRGEEMELQLDWKPVFKNGKLVFVL